ncbi:MAG TPA: hypothetical protein VF190_14405 [Rhodothermales bacterium]
MQLAGLDTSQDAQRIPLEVLSHRLGLSQQTLVRWVDRHLVDARLGWRLNGSNQEERFIEVLPDSLSALEKFAKGYREDTVSRSEARRILKVIDRRKVKSLLRSEQVQSREVDGETCILVGSLEDYLIGLEGPIAHA